jgi:GrpB-like predicted nucleotidyltransferase (UPF0157 family)
VAAAVREDVAIVPYDPAWPRLFWQEAEHLLVCLPLQLLQRIEHFGSTAVPGLAAKPVIDMLVEVTSLRATRKEIVPILKGQGYDYFWRPTMGNDEPPWYPFFINRNADRVRTHHIHMVTRRPGFQGHWDRLLFRDYLISHPGVAREYAALKQGLAKSYPNDRAAYTNGKTAFILRITAKARSEASCCLPARKCLRP